MGATDQPLLARALKAVDPYDSKLEREYASRLEWLKNSGQIRDWRYHPFNIRLAKGDWYVVDFMVINVDDTIECIETKGYRRNIRDSLGKWKMAAELLPWFRWVFETARGSGRALRFERQVYGEGRVAVMTKKRRADVLH